MTYTKAQRHKIYKRALARISNDSDYWLCWALSNTISLADLNNFPEVLKQEPLRKLDADCWFNTNEAGKAKRLTILRNAIKWTKPKGRKK